MLKVETCLGLKSPPSPSGFQKNATMLDHQHKHFSGNHGKQIACIDVKWEPRPIAEECHFLDGVT